MHGAYTEVLWLELPKLATAGTIDADGVHHIECCSCLSLLSMLLLLAVEFLMLVLLAVVF